MGITVRQASDAPSEQIIAVGQGTETVTDSTGRTFTVRKLSPFDRMRMSKVVGAENSANQSYMIYALVAYSLKEINGDPVAPPRTEAELEHLVQRLGEEGYQAALDAVVSFYGTPTESGEFLEAAKK